MFSAKDGISRKWRFGEDSAGDTVRDQFGNIFFGGSVYDASVIYIPGYASSMHPHNLQHILKLMGLGRTLPKENPMQFALKVCYCNISCMQDADYIL